MAPHSFNQYRVAVIGCGIFGAVAALRLAEDGVDVAIFERCGKILSGASWNNQNRLHRGFHYPRDFETARQCIRGFEQFQKMFPDCVVDVRPNTYFIASESSRTSPKDYLQFVDRLGARYETMDVATFQPMIQNVACGIFVHEAIYDAALLRTELFTRLAASDIRLRLHHDVEQITRNETGFVLDHEEKFDAVVNCAYAEIDHLGAQLEHPRRDLQYEYTAISVVEWAQPPIGITIMDGPFATILPFGQTGQFLVYHVDHSVVERIVSTRLPRTWRDASTGPLSDTKRRKEISIQILDGAAHFVPDLASARVVDILEGPRVVLPHVDATDARPSIVTSPEPGYVTVLSGKVDHCVQAAENVVSILKELR